MHSDTFGNLNIYGHLADVHTPIVRHYPIGQ